MFSAIDAVQHGHLKMTEAAKLFGIPRQALGDRISERAVHGTKPGPKLYLTRKEEFEFAGFLVDTAESG